MATPTESDRPVRVDGPWHVVSVSDGFRTLTSRYGYLVWSGFPEDYTEDEASLKFQAIVASLTGGSRGNA